MLADGSKAWVKRRASNPGVPASGPGVARSPTTRSSRDTGGAAAGGQQEQEQAQAQAAPIADGTQVGESHTLHVRIRRGLGENEGEQESSLHRPMAGIGIRIAIVPRALLESSSPHAQPCVLIKGVAEGGGAAADGRLRPGAPPNVLGCGLAEALHPPAAALHHASRGSQVAVYGASDERLFR